MSSAVQLINRIKSLRNAIVQYADAEPLREFPHVQVAQRPAELSTLGSNELRQRATIQWEREDRHNTMTEISKILVQLQDPNIDVVNPKSLRQVLECK